MPSFLFSISFLRNLPSCPGSLLFHPRFPHRRSCAQHLLVHEFHAFYCIVNGVSFLRSAILKYLGKDVLHVKWYLNLFNQVSKYFADAKNIVLLDLDVGLIDQVRHDLAVLLFFETLVMCQLILNCDRGWQLLYSCIPLRGWQLLYHSVCGNCCTIP